MRSLGLIFHVEHSIGNITLLSFKQCLPAHGKERQAIVAILLVTVVVLLRKIKSMTFQALPYQSPFKVCNC